METAVWWIVGVIVAFAAALFAWALCKIAGDLDEIEEYEWRLRGE